MQYLGIDELRGSVFTIFEKSGTATTRTPSIGLARTRKLCAAAVLGLACFASSTRAYADTTLPVPGVTAADAVDAASSAAAAQASAIVEEASSATSEVAPQTAAPPAGAVGTGSGSGTSGDISAGTTPPSQPATPPTNDVSVPSAEEVASAAVAAVVAPTEPVVSPPQDTRTGPTASSEASSPSSDTGGQYQQNPGRYQPRNFIPISDETGSDTSPIVVGESSPQPTPTAGHTSAPKSSQIPLPKCPQDLPDSAFQPACENALSQLGDIAAAVGAAPAHNTASPTKASSRPRSKHAPTAHSEPRRAKPAHRIHPVAWSTPRGAFVVSATSKAARPARTHRPGLSSRARHQRPARIGNEAQPSLETLHADTPQREASPREKPAGAEGPPLFVAALLALLLGLASLALSFASIGERRRAVVTSIATRVRSKGLSSAAQPPPGRRREVPPGIRYRE